MRFSTALVTGVSRTKEGDVALDLESINGKCPERLVVMRPPAKNFDTVVDCVLEISFESVYIQGILWAKRSTKYRNFVHLVARKA